MVEDGLGKASRDDLTWWARNSGGGAGNPGGNGGHCTSGIYAWAGNSAQYKGNDGTGGLLNIISNKFNNLGKCEANGVQGCSTNAVGGGCSGGGSINIFANTIENVGEMQAIGGVETPTLATGGAGGKGCITVGTITSGSFASI